MGAWLRKTTPANPSLRLASVPKPDVLVYNTNQCRDVQDWFAFYQRELGVPLLGIQTPRSIGELGSEHIRQQATQLQAMIPKLEAIASERFDIDPSP